MKYPFIKLQKITFLAFILFNIKTLNVKNSNANANCNEKECFQMSSSKNVVPEAKEALNRFKMEAANEVGVNLKQGYNGDLTSKQAGSIGGQMVNVMCPVRTVHFQRTNWAKNNQLQPITYEFCIAV